LFITQVGYCHLQIGYPEDASGHFKSLLNKGCAGSDDYNGLFCAYYDMGLLDDAIEVAKEGIRKFPKDEGLKEFLKIIEDEIDNPDDDDKKPPIKEILIISALIKKLCNKRAFRPKK